MRVYTHTPSVERGLGDTFVDFDLLRSTERSPWGAPVLSKRFEEDQQSGNFVKFTDFFISVNLTHSLIVGKSTRNNMKTLSPRN